MDVRVFNIDGLVFGLGLKTCLYKDEALASAVG
jgi:hypothetical protein